MPTVPFTGVPSVAPELNPTPRYEANVRPESFGVNVAQAVHGMGNTLTGAGNEMFARGVAMQDLYNHSQAQEADVKYMKAAGELHANFSSLAGKNAVEAYPKLGQDLEDARKTIRDGLPNDMARKLYDSQSLSTMGRTIFNGAGHAATENKKYAIGTAAAKVEESTNQMLANPNDGTLANQSIADIERNVEAQGVLEGWGPDKLQLKKEEAVSYGWLKRISGLVKQEPMKAGKMRDEAVQAGALQGEDIGKANNIIQQAQLNQGSRMIAAQVSSGADWVPGSKIVSQPRARQAVASFEGTYSSIGPTVTDKAGTTGYGLGRYQVMSYNLQPWLKEAGMPAMTEQQFLKDSKAQDDLFDAKFGGYQQKYGSFNSAVKAWFGGEGSVNVDPSKLSDKYHNATQYLNKTNQVLARNAPLEEQYARSDQMAKDQAPDNVLLPEATRTQVLGNFNRTVAAEKNEIFTTKNTLLQQIAAVSGGKKPTSVEELIATKPENADLWDKLGRLDPATQSRYRDILSNNLKDDYGPSDMATREVSRMKAMAEDHPAEFTQIDMDKWREKYQIPRTQWGRMLDLQAEKNKDPTVKDLAAQQAMTYLAPTLPPDFSDKRNHEEYLLFKGVLMDQLQDFYQRNKKPAGLEDIKKMGAQIQSQQHAAPGEFWFNSSTDKLYKLPTPSKLIEDTKKLEPGITDEEIHRRYIRLQYNDLFNKPKAQ